MNMSFVRHYARYDDRTVFHDSLTSFLSCPVAAGINTIATDSTPLDIHIVDRQAATTIVIFHAAANPAEVSLPLFVGQQLTEHLPANLVFVSDPALDRGVPVGWFAGDESHPFQEDLVRIIAHVQDGLTTADHLIFFGPSAGGFASLYFSHHFPGSLAIVANPQTNIEKYNKEHVEFYRQGCWSGKALANTSITYDVVPLYRESFPNWVAYLQNKDDALHVEEHLEPWRTAAGAFPDRWRTLPGDWGEGHAPAPLYLLVGILGYAIAVEGDWEAFLADEMFTQPS